MGKIRNISQTVQEREVIKTSPDLVVYLEGLPYIQNYYLPVTLPNGTPAPTLVNFNDHLTAFSANYDLDSAIPNATFTLVIPAHQRYLYQAPGGNNLITSMMQVQVFMKGYYFANDGNTVFHRVFKGFTSHITHTDDGKTLTISVQCAGILGLFQMMQMDLSPAIQSSAQATVTPFKSILASMSPYAQMAFAFLYPSFTDGFQLISLKQQAIEDTPFFDAIQHGYIAKWQSILSGLASETHIYGLQNKDLVGSGGALSLIQSIAKTSSHRNKLGWTDLAAAEARYAKIKESDQFTDIQNTAKIRNFLPDYGLGTIELLNHKVISRLEFLRSLTRLVNYECYQDIDGQIILKPALYNLDVTNMGNLTTDASKKYTAAHPRNAISNKNNPFIVHLAEISNEMETEDQGAIRATRMVLQGNTSTTQQFVNLPPLLRGISEFVDLPKLAQFGLREEPARSIPWLTDQEPLSVFAQCAAEMALANRGFRSYSFTIPARPELHLGFPMFIPHRDMYGYIKGISLQYQIGGSANMSITLDALRKRVMIPQAQIVNGQKTTVFRSVPNLVLKWTPGVNPSTGQPNSKKVAASTTANDPSNSSPVNPVGSPTSLAKTSPVSPDQQALLDFQNKQLGSYYGLASDTTDASWQISNDTVVQVGKGKTPFSDGNFVWSSNPPNSPGFSRQVNSEFYLALRTTVPYTDEKGYEVIAPFPWGRWLDIKTALYEITSYGYVVPPTGPTAPAQPLLNTEAFLYAGMETPNIQGDSATAAQDAVGKLQAGSSANPNSGSNNTTGTGTQVVMDTDPGSTAQPNANFGQPLKNSSGQVVTSNTPPTALVLTTVTEFELAFTTPTTPGGQNSIINVGQPDNALDANLLANDPNSEQQKVNMFLTGALPAPNPALKAALAAVGNRGLSAGEAVTPTSPVLTASLISLGNDPLAKGQPPAVIAP